MPLIDVSIARGRTPDQLRGLMTALHDAVEESIGAPSDSITVVIREIEREHWSRANTTIAERNGGQTVTEDK